MKGIVKVEGDTLTFCYVYAQERTRSARSGSPSGIRPSRSGRRSPG